MNIIEQLETEQMDKLTKTKNIPEFGSGDIVRVQVKVVEGERERLQAFEGVCIARKSAALNSSFTVRKIASGEGVERVFPLYGPNVATIEVVRRGDVRRAKLYYLRGLTGKRARIAEMTTGNKAKLNTADKVTAAAAKAERDAAAATAKAERDANAPAKAVAKKRKGK